MQTPDSNATRSRLQRFGPLLLDLTAVIAVEPIFEGKDRSQYYGFRIQTHGGLLEWSDTEACNSLRQLLYGTDPICTPDSHNSRQPPPLVAGVGARG